MALPCYKKLSALFKGITSNHDGDFYCLNCFHSFATKNKLKKHKSIPINHDYCHIEMPKKYNTFFRHFYMTIVMIYTYILNNFKEILKYNHGKKSIKVHIDFYVDTESLSE